jgi:hypothetical protein
MGSNHMGSPKRRPTARGGYSLVEGMIASVLLAGSVVGVSGTVLSSMAHDQHSREQSAAMRSGSQLMDEVAALPISSTHANRVSLMDFANYADDINAEASLPIVPAVAAVKAHGGAGAPQGDDDEDDEDDLPGGNTGQNAPEPAPVARNPYSANRVVSIERRQSVGGPIDSNGDFAIVSVSVTGANGRTIVIKRLVSAAEGLANAN